jgi:hypothetical protein
MIVMQQARERAGPDEPAAGTETGDDLLPEISTRDNLENSVEKTEGSYQDEEDQVHRRTDD